MFSALGFGSSKPSKPPKAVPSITIGAQVKDESIASDIRVKNKTENLPGQTEIDSVAKRSVRISIPKGGKSARAIEDDIYQAASMFGTITDIRIKGKNAVVLYSTAVDADRCLSKWSDTTLASQDYRAKSMGNTSLNQSSDSINLEEMNEAGSLSGSNNNSGTNLVCQAPVVNPNILSEGIAFDGSVMESNQIIHMIELEDVSNFDRTIDGNISLDNGRIAGKGVVAGQSSLKSVNQDISLVAGTDESGIIDSYSPEKPSITWKVAEKPKNPPVRPAKPAHLSTKPTGNNEIDSESEKITPKALTPKQIRVSKDVSFTNDPGQVHDNANQTYISSANDSSVASSDSVSMYNGNYDGDATSTFVNNMVNSASKPNIRSNSSQDTSEQSNRSTDGVTFLTQSIPLKPAKTPKPRTPQIGGTVENNKGKASSPDTPSHSTDGDSISGIEKPLFGNILDIPRPAAEYPNTSHTLGDVLQYNASGTLRTREERNSTVENLLQRIRVLEAEARVSARERLDFGEEIRRTEENWAVELTALGIRNKALETENIDLREENQLAKIELAKLASEISALHSKKSTQAMTSGSFKSEADRVAFGALLAQQNLVKVLTSHKEASEAQVEILKTEVESLARAHRTAMEENYEWKRRAAVAEEEVIALRSTSAETSEIPENPSLPVLHEISSRKVLNRELEKYLSLERTMATPMLAQKGSAENVWKYSSRETQFDVFFDIATESSRFAAENVSKQKPAYLGSVTGKHSHSIPTHWRTKQ